MKKIGDTIVPRNPHAVAASQRKAGRHEKNPKNERQQSKKEIENELVSSEENKKTSTDSEPLSE